MYCLRSYLIALRLLTRSLGEHLRMETPFDGYQDSERMRGEAGERTREDGWWFVEQANRLEKSLLAQLDP